jgi:hypothetical protein
VTIVADRSIVSLRHSLPLQCASVTALFPDAAVVQMMNDKNSFFSSLRPLSRAFCIGNGRALEFAARAPPTHAVVLATNGSDFAAKFEYVAVGSPLSRDHWTTKDWGEESFDVSKGQSFEASLALAPNSRDFPALTLRTGPNAALDDLTALLTGIYGSPVGAFASYELPGEVGPTIHHPDTSYAGGGGVKPHRPHLPPLKFSRFPLLAHHLPLHTATTV